MGAKCCTSGAAAVANSAEVGLDSFFDGGIGVDAAEPADFHSSKPLWLLEHEERQAAKSVASNEQPPVYGSESPTAGEHGDATEEARPETPVKKGSSRRPRSTGAGKARARPPGQARKQSLEEEPSSVEKQPEPSAAKPPLMPESPKKTPVPDQLPESDRSDTPTDENENELREMLHKSIGGATGRVLYHVLKVTILGARELRNADSPLSNSDPYCVCEIRGKKASRFKTKVMQDTLDPLWCHTVQMSGFEGHDALEFTIYDKDLLTSDDKLGMAVLKNNKIIPMGFEGELKLKMSPKSKDNNYAGFLQVKVEHLRSCTSSRRVRPKTKQIENGQNSAPCDVSVHIYGAKGLRNADWAPGQGVSDPYCTCEVPGKPSTLIKTDVVDNSLNPKWDYRSQLQGYCVGDPLVFTVYDKDVMKSDDFLGRATLDGSKLLNGGYYGDLALNSLGKIRVKVTILESQSAVSSCATPTDPEFFSEEASERPVSSRVSRVSVGDHSTRMQGAVFKAAEEGDLKSLKTLLEAGLGVDIRNPEGFTPLHLAAKNGQEDFVARLLREKNKKQQLVMKTPDNDTALHLAAKGDFKSVCVALVKGGANLKAKNAAGETPAALAKGDLAQWLQCEDPVNTPPPWA